VEAFLIRVGCGFEPTVVGGGIGELVAQHVHARVSVQATAASTHIGVGCGSDRPRTGTGRPVHPRAFRHAPRGHYRQTHDVWSRSEWSWSSWWRSDVGWARARACRCLGSGRPDVVWPVPWVDLGPSPRGDVVRDCPGVRSA
jgi:hypothetical protein